MKWLLIFVVVNNSSHFTIHKYTETRQECEQFAETLKPQHPQHIYTCIQDVQPQ